MKPDLLKILPGTALAALMLVSAVTWSGGFNRGPGMDDGRLLSRMAEKLQLDESQKQEVQTLMQGSHQAGQADFARMGEIREALQAMRGSFDAGEAQKLSSELGEISARIAYRMTETNARVYAVLTPGQREELDEMRDQRQQRGKGRRHAPGE